MIENLTEPLAPLLGNVVAPLAPVVDGLTAPLAPVIDNLTAPLSPVVDGVVTALPPAVADILSPRAPQPEDIVAPRPGLTAPSTQAPAPATSLVPPGDGGPATPQLTPNAVELPAVQQPPADLPQTRTGLDPRAPQAGSPAHIPAGHATFPNAPYFSAAPHAAGADVAASQTDAPAGNAPSQQQPLPAPSGASAGAGAGSGVAAATLFALLLSLAAFGLRHSTRLRLPSMAWRQQAFLAVIERPG